MEGLSSVDMQDYWNEYRTVRGRIAELRGQRGSHSEEDSRSHDDDSDDTFLDTVLPDRLKEDREISETELVNSRLYYTLTERQKAQLMRRAQERNHTLRQRRLKVRNQKPDLWSVFSGTDNSSTGTRSRSATPDSLDSISPPRTPPDPNPKNWVDSHLSRSRASLDSGHHSLIMTPSSSLSPTSPPSTSPQHLELPLESRKPKIKNGKRALGRRHSPPDVDSRYYYPPEEFVNTNRIYRPPSLDILSEIQERNDVNRPSKEITVRRQRSYARDISRDVKSYYANKGQYEFNPRLFYSQEIPDVLGLNYKQIGSLHIPHCKAKEKRDPFDQNLHQDPSRNTTSIRRTQSIKHHPRDPFDQNDRGGETHLKTNCSSVISTDSYPEGLRGKGSADLGFRIFPTEKKEKYPDIVLEVGRSGQTKINWMNEQDLESLRSLSLLELDIIFTEHNIQHSWRKRNKKKKVKEAENVVFGASLETLLEKDRTYLTESSYEELHVPQALQKLISHLEFRGLRDEGILRIPGNRAKTEDLRRCFDESFYGAPHHVDDALRNGTPNEIASLIKLFLRELPHPLLTYCLSLAFYKTHKISNLGERILALNMLIILLPAIYRDTLRVVLDLCARIVEYEDENKMGLYNVAMIMAPNIFLPSLQPKSKLQIRSDDKEQQLNTEMEYARITTELVQALIKYRDVLWIIPNRLIAQVRHQYESSLKSSNSKPIHKLLTKKPKELIHRPIMNEVDYQNGVLRISAPQFSKLNYPIKLDWKMTAKDILTRFIEEESSAIEKPRRVSGRREQKKTPLMRTQSGSDVSSHFPSYAPPLPHPSAVAMTTCLLRGSLRHALDNHALHEKGGNITEKRVDHNAFLIAVYQDNPNGEFLVKCHHPGGQIEL